MKITKQMLKELIKEELETLGEMDELQYEEEPVVKEQDEDDDDDERPAAKKNLSQISSRDLKMLKNCVQMLLKGFETILKKTSNSF